MAAVSGILVACASSPDKIDAAFVSAFKYEPYSCEQIAFDMAVVARHTQSLYDNLKSARRHDKWQAGVGVILLPTLFALEGGDGVEASEYAVLKGEFESLLYASMQKRCGFEPLSPDGLIEEALTEDTMIVLPDNRRVSLSQMLGFLEQAHTQGLVSDAQLNAARDTAFMLLGSNGDGHNLPLGSLDNFYALINELEIALPLRDVQQVATAPAAVRAPDPAPRALAPASSARALEAVAPPNTQRIESLARRVEALAPPGDLQSIQPIVADEPSAAMPSVSAIQAHDAPVHFGAKTLESILREYAHLENFYVDEIPQWKLVQFFNKAGIVNTTPVLGYIDTTLWGSGKHGVLFTPEGIYYSNDFVAGVGGTFFIAYDDIAQHAQPNFEKRYFYLGFGGLPKRGLIDFVGNDTDLESLLSMIEEIQANYEPTVQSVAVALSR